MIVSPVEFVKVAVSQRRIVAGVVDGACMLFVVDYSADCTSYFLGTSRGAVRLFKSFSAVRSFIKKYPVLLDCDIHLNYSE